MVIRFSVITKTAKWRSIWWWQFREQDGVNTTAAVLSTLLDNEELFAADNHWLCPSVSTLKTENGAWTITSSWESTPQGCKRNNCVKLVIINSRREVRRIVYQEQWLILPGAQISVSEAQFSTWTLNSPLAGMWVHLQVSSSSHLTDLQSCSSNQNTDCKAALVLHPHNLLPLHSTRCFSWILALTHRGENSSQKKMHIAPTALLKGVISNLCLSADIIVSGGVVVHWNCKHPSL